MTTPTDVTIQAACPPFAGTDRKMWKSGFVLHMPKKAYLTSTLSNISLERGILSFFCYDLAEAASDASSDRTGFLIYTKLGSSAASMTTGRNIHGLDVLCDVDSDYAVTTNLRNADVRGARIQVYGHNNVSGICTGLYVNCQLRAAAAGTYTFDGRLMEAISFAGGIGLEVRIEAVFVPDDGSAADTVAIGSAGGGAQAFIGILVSYQGKCKLTGNMYSIFLEKPKEGGAVSGETVGIKFDEDNMYASETDFDVGIDFGATTVTAMKIGTTSTAVLDFTGATAGTTIWEDSKAAPDKAGSFKILTPAGATAYINYYDGTRAT